MGAPPNTYFPNVVFDGNDFRDPQGYDGVLLEQVIPLNNDLTNSYLQWHAARYPDDMNTSVSICENAEDFALGPIWQSVLSEFPYGLTEGYETLHFISI